MDFIKGILQLLSESPDAEVLKIKRVNVATGQVAALVMLAKSTANEAFVVFQLITSNNGNGFIVSCGGNVDHMEEFAPLCLRTMPTFSIKSGDKKVKVPTSAPKSTQTNNTIL